MHEENKATFAALDQRVLGLEGDVQALGQRLDVGLSTLRTDLVSSLRDIHSKLDHRDDRRWVLGPAIAFGLLILAIIGGLGTLSLNPVKDRVGELRIEMSDSRRELLEFDRQFREDQRKIRTELDFLRGQLHPLKP